jgi:hypothetical protein
MKKSFYCSLGIIFLIWSGCAAAQHYSHTFRYTGDVEIDHMPDHDEILAAEPENLLLRFTQPVALVKLVVKTAEGSIVNINFRYDPIPSRVFIWPVPELPASAYYSVDWGAVDLQNKMMTGQFLFAAGPDAIRPSSLVPEPDNEAHIKVPDYRLLDLNIFRPVN